MDRLARSKACNTATAAATIRPRVGTTRLAARAHGLVVGVRSRYKALYHDIAAGACSLVGVCHDTLGCIVTGGGLTSWDGSRYNQLYRDRRGFGQMGVSLDTARSSAAIRPPGACDTTERGSATRRPVR